MDPPAATYRHRLASAGLSQQCETILAIYSAPFPTWSPFIDRDFNIFMSNWHRSEVPEECGAASPSATGFIIAGTAPATDCHVLTVFATGQPQKIEKI